MAKNVVSKAWVLLLGEDNRRYSDAPIDETPPSAPTIEVTDTQQTSVSLRVITPSIDARHPVVSYTFEFSDDGGDTWTERVPVGAIQAETGFQMTSLTPSTAYQFRARGTDGSVSANMSAYSNIAEATTDASTAVTSWFPNWPTMTTQTLQGNSSDNYLDPTQWEYLADFDVIIVQNFFPTTNRLTQRVSAINGIRALQTAPMNTKFLIYTGYQQVLVNDSGDSGLSVSKAVIEDAITGNDDWYMKRIPPNDGQILTANFASTVRQLNIATEAGLNSLGETYAEAFWKEWKNQFDTGVAATDIFDVMNGVFQDNTNDRIPAVWNAAHTAQVTDYDLDYDGVADGRADFSANGGATMWSNGTKASKEEFEANFPNMVQVPNLSNSSNAYFDGAGQPPLPLGNHPFYQYWEMPFDETVQLGFGIQKTATQYTYSGVAGFGPSLRHWAIMERLLKPDAQNTITGRSCVIAHSIGIDRATTQEDLEYARFLSALALLHERTCTGVSHSGRHVLPLDELLFALGNPLHPRGMGTLNENNVTFTLRAADQTVGVAKFYWARFENGIVVVRGDQPQSGGVLYPNAQAAVTCTLPDPGEGKHWEMIDADNYTNPITSRTMRNQSPSINNGATVTTLSMKPWTARWVARVDD